MRNMDAFIFDLDGTLLDTLDDLAASANHALAVYGLPTHSIDDIRRFVGNGVRKLMERAVPGGENHPLFEEVLSTFREYYMEHERDTTQPYPGIIPLLRQLKALNKSVAVVSNKFDAATKSLCAHYFGSLVDVAIGESEHIQRKPAPDTVMEALRLLGIPAGRAVYIGDSDVDITTAANCGMPCISVLWGFRDRNFLLAHGATTLVENPKDILTLS